MTSEKRKTKNEKRGQTLFELVIALAVVVLVITGIVKAVTTAIKNSAFARNKSEATRYSQEAMEWVKTERDKKSWNDFTGKTLSSKACMSTLSWPTQAVPCDTGLDSNKIQNTVFFRNITIQDTNKAPCESTDSSCDITVEVFWLDTDTTQHTSTLQTRVTNWRESQ